MKIRKTDGSNEREILIGMIVNSIVCGRIADKWDKRLFRSKWANIVSSWCVTYFKKYNKAPRKQIESLYRSWERKSHDKETVKIVNKFLSGLSDEYAELKRDSNPKYVLDKAGEYFSEVKLERLQEDLESSLTANDISKALTRVSEFDAVKLGKGEVINIFTGGASIWKSAFQDELDGLVKYPGKLGEFLGNQLGRDMFVGFMGPEGRGKSFILMDIAFRAALQRRRVAFFEAGDMSESQILRRLATRIAQRPMRACTLQYPKGIYYQKKTKQYALITEDRVFKTKLDWRDALKASRKLRRRKIRSKDEYLQLICHSNSTLSVSMIETYLKEWARDGWLADVIVIDYSDILDMSYPKLEGRDKIDKLWRELRRLSQVYHCLVVTATQTNRLSYDAVTITRKHSSEDKRKLAHVTGMMGINQTEEEKKKGIMRLNWIKVRDAEYLESKCVTIAGCLALGNVAIRSAMEDKRRK